MGLHASTGQHAVPSGTLLAGRYELGALLGVGSTAAVHRARDHRTSREVAVKLITSGGAGPGARPGQHEAAVLAGLHHPGLVPLLDTGSADGRFFLVVELVDGPVLSHLLDAGPLPVAAAAALGAALADALAHAHARGVVHRDVKPANVLVDRCGRPTLADFGIARLVDAARVTPTGCIVGTAAYLAPEQVRGTAVGPAADVYALGLVTLEAATGTREYPGTALEAAVARLHRPPRTPAGLPASLATTLRRMTADDPARRPTAAQASALLTRAGLEALPVRATRCAA